MAETRSHLSNETLAQEASVILDILQNEKINSYKSPQLVQKLHFLRDITSKLAQTIDIRAIGLTARTATTLFKVGLCEELANRFALEYFLKYKKNNISLIYLSNPDEGFKNEDHVFVHVGNLNAPETLIIGKTLSTIEPKKNNLDFMTYLQNNKNSVIADPLLNCLGNIENGLDPLLDYCKKYHLTHVIAIGSFADLTIFVENAEIIKNNAIFIATCIKRCFNINDINEPLELNLHSLSNLRLFSKPQPMIKIKSEHSDLNDETKPFSNCYGKRKN